MAYSTVSLKHKRSSKIGRIFNFFWKNWFNWLVLIFFLHLFFFKEVRIQVSVRSVYSDPISSTKPIIVSEKEASKAIPAANSPDRHHSYTKFSNLSFVLGSEVAIPASVRADNNEKCQKYIERFVGIARAEQKKYGIPAAIVLAQALLASDAGENEPAATGNNHFALLCPRDCEDCACRQFDHDDGRRYRQFETSWESFRAHSLLLNSDRFKHLLALDPNDYRKWVKGLWRAGYSTDRKYVARVIAIIEGLGLQRYNLKKVHTTAQ